MDRLRHMEIFVSVVEAGQFTRASRILSLSKSTVSQAVSSLEAYLGLLLVNRDSRSFLLTTAGQAYYEQCTRVLSDINTLEDDMRGKGRGMSGLIRLTAPTLYGTLILQPLIVEFMKMHPDVSFDIKLTEQAVDLVADGVDVAFRLGDIKDSALLMRKIGSLKMVVCATPEYLETHGVPKVLEDLEDHNCLIFGSIPGWNFLKDGVRYVFPAKGMVQTSCANSLRGLVCAGVGIGYFPKFVFQADLDLGTVVSILEDDSNVSFDVNLIRPAGKHLTIRVAKFTDFMISNLQKNWPV